MAGLRTLVGNWLIRDNQVIADDVCREIERLLSTRLNRVAARDEGWTVLYQDRLDDSYWELTYPHSEWHGGGPPTLVELAVDDARRLYPELTGR
ncbi:MAG: Imm27 family immunity protein [Bryobacteraceae bacterium]